jgi:hypothetical protein
MVKVKAMNPQGTVLVQSLTSESPNWRVRALSPDSRLPSIKPTSRALLSPHYTNYHGNFPQPSIKSSRMAAAPDMIATPTIANVPIEFLINTANYLPKNDSLGLSQISKKFSEVAQDVLYREVNRSQRYYKNSQQHHSKIASFLGTIARKPHLAAKVKHITWWPRSKDVLYRMPHASPAGPASSLLIGPLEVLFDEQKLAADLLTRFADLRTIEFVRKDKEILKDGRHLHECPIVDKMPLRLNDLSAIPGLSKLESLRLEEGALG